MKLNLVRTTYTDKSTIGKLYINGIQFCYTLEDKFRSDNEEKIWGKTAIPCGTYEITYRTESEMLEKEYKTRFADIKNERGMLWIRNIPGFEYVYIHVGNDDNDTNGCILVGTTKAVDFVGNSVIAYKVIYKMIADELDKGNKVLITVEKF